MTIILAMIFSHRKFLFTVCFLLLAVSQRKIFGQVFAVIGDYGDAVPAEDSVSRLVKGWNPEFIITCGDNNYPNGDYTTIDTNIGFFYHQYIFPYIGIYSDSTDTATVNRFFPSLGNHDLLTLNGQPYYDYFTLPNNERYYDFVWGNVHLFALNSNPSEPDGTSASSSQAGWLSGKLSSSVSKWKLIYFHHSAYSSGGKHGSSTWMQWPFDQWGATAVFGGHNHIYERLSVNGIPYFVNGIGGRYLYGLGPPLPESIVQYNTMHGAIKVLATDSCISFEFRNTLDSLIDSVMICNAMSVPSFSENLFSINVFPNPFSLQTRVGINRKLYSGRIIILDVLRREIMRLENLAGSEFIIQRGNIKTGLFLCVMYENELPVGYIKMAIVD